MARAWQHQASCAANDCAIYRMANRILGGRSANGVCLIKKGTTRCPFLHAYYNLANSKKQVLSQFRNKFIVNPSANGSFPRSNSHEKPAF